MRHGPRHTIYIYEPHAAPFNIDVSDTRYVTQISNLALATTNKKKSQYTQLKASWCAVERRKARVTCGARWQPNGHLLVADARRRSSRPHQQTQPAYMWSMRTFLCVYPLGCKYIYFAISSGSSQLVLCVRWRFCARRNKRSWWWWWEFIEAKHFWIATFFCVWFRESVESVYSYVHIVHCVLLRVQCWCFCWRHWIRRRTYNLLGNTYYLVVFENVYCTIKHRSLHGINILICAGEFAHLLFSNINYNTDLIHV